MKDKNNKFVVGLTGGIGSGKSAATALFEKHKIDIIDADQVARDVVEIGSEGLAKIAEHFGNDILLESGALNRAALREQVFNNESEKQWLNSLLHPLIRQQMLTLIAVSNSPYCILSVPLLVENKLTVMCDKVVVVDCPEAMQLSRAMQRDGSTEQTIKNIMASQADRDTRLAAADFVLDNSSSLAHLAQQVDELHQTLLPLSSSHQ
jgi:dephospho-CoA kinase